MASRGVNVAGSGTIENQRSTKIDSYGTRCCGGGGGGGGSEYEHNDNELTRPNFRVSLPWTVKNQDTFRQKNTQENTTHMYITLVGIY